MKKIKQFSLKAMLLTILAALTIGFTGCSDELSGDQTQGKPGYLSINIKTLQPKQTKIGTDGATDFQDVKNLNIFIFDGSDNLILNRYYDGTTTPALPAVSTGTVGQIDIKVNTLPSDAYVVAVANYGSRIASTVTSLSLLTNLEVSTVKDFEDEGLYMTGRADITRDVAGFIYTSNVKVAPIVSKITVQCKLTDDVLDWYDLAGIYIVNAIDKTKLPIIRTNTGAGVGSDNTILSLITPTIAAKTASSGLPTITDAASGISRDYNFYNGLTGNVTYLKDEGTFTLTSGTSSFYHYYVGENYHAALPTTAGTGSLVTNATDNANTLIVVKVTPNGSCPAYLAGAGAKYYTYDLSNTIPNNVYNINGTSITSPTTWDATNGFSTKRKTNYTVTFNLSQLGADKPYIRMKTLRVNVEAQGWEPATPSFYN